MQASPVFSAQRPDYRLHLILLVAVTVVAWAPALGGAFQYDDLPNIVLDPATSDRTALLTRLGNGFRPLLRLSFAADYALWGFTPAGFLAANLTLHILTVLAIWRLARDRLGDPLAALLAALVFAVQPVHAATVAWTSGRSAGLSTLLLCLALLAHERGTCERGWRWPAASVAFMMLAAAVKEVALIFPAIVLLWELTRGERAGHGQLFRRVVLSVLAALSMLVFMLAVSPRLRELLAFSFAYAPPGEALLDHVRALPVSLSLWFRPWALAIEHLAPEGMLALLLGASTLIAMIAAGVCSLRRWPLLVLALLWPLVMLLPSHSLIARVDLVVEKPLYAAWIGPSLGLGGLFAMWLRASAAMPVRAVAATVLVVFTCTAHWRAWVWADPAALWREASEAAPQSPRAWSNRAVAALEANDLADARFALKQAQALDPSDPRLEDIEHTLGLIALTEKEVLPR